MHSASLRLHGNQLNYITTSWTVGYVIGHVPSKLSSFDLYSRYLIVFQYAYYARPTVDMGKLVMAQIPVLGWLTSTLFLDSDNGVNMGFTHYVSCCEQGLFNPLRGTVLYRVGRVNFFPAIQVCFMISHDGCINYS